MYAVLHSCLDESSLDVNNVSSLRAYLAVARDRSHTENRKPPPRHAEGTVESAG